MRRSTSALLLFACLLQSSCQDGDQVPFVDQQRAWSWVAKSDAAALLSVHGTSESDVWIAGADDGQGPVVLHFDGQEWQRRDTGAKGDLWWVNATPQGPVYFAGASGLLLRYQGGAFERLKTPALGKDVLYGVWAAGAEDLYAVGTSAGKNGFIWHYDGSQFESVALPDTLPLDENHDQPGLFKVWGNSKDSVWVAGASGTLLHGNAREGFTLVRKGQSEILFTVNARGDHVLAVGGTSSGLLLDGRATTLNDRTPASTPLLQGAWIDEHDQAWAVGVGGTVLRSGPGGFEVQDTGLDFAANDSLHSVWVDPAGGVWAVGGDVLTPNLAHGLALHGGAPVPEIDLTTPEPPAAVCPEAQIDPAPHGSIARRWDEQILGAIRRDVPRPGVHARNLFHTSIALWDAYAIYDSTVSGYLTSEHRTASNVDSAREEAISYAAYRVLSHRYASAVGGGVSQACFDAFMHKLGYDPHDTQSTGSTPRALGNRIGQAVIAAFADDGANEANNYADPDGFEPNSPNLVVDHPGCHADDPTEWQRLVLAKAETQNGIPANAGAQVYIGGQWGTVTPFALTRAKPGEPYLDIGHPPVAFDDALVDAAIEVLRKTSWLDVEDDTLIDVSPGAMGNNPLGSNDGHGHAKNPVTGKPYAAHPIKRSDFGRVLAEFWADGPTSETPPGHWNVIANHVADDPAFERRLFGSGAVVDPLTWDVHTYLALNGALHDAAIAAWELKRKYVTARPITLIRYMAERGQRSDPNAPSYDPQGLPLIDGLSELITAESSAPGERHEKLARYVGEVAVRSWRGEPGNRVSDIAGVDWMRGVEWIPYQRRTFVTPAFPGYLSGHSTFSRAAATVLTGLTGSEYFPGGFGSYSFDPGYLFFEHGPSEKVSLEWGTYFDAADQAGQSRLWGGIHVQFDDFDGRRLGARIGSIALDRARTLFGLASE
ncbi:MAG TPA: vanadium-dependent haloperoxidase [Polyangiaceae bacterium]|nr:vanadium-dependent haloperoxidase [Polyangiaceae bacterium]